MQVRYTTGGALALDLVHHVGTRRRHPRSPWRARRGRTQ
jgi:hypothetical protein